VQELEISCCFSPDFTWEEIILNTQMSQRHIKGSFGFYFRKVITFEVIFKLDGLVLGNRMIKARLMS
jgi:hypothetical protein